MRNDPKRRARHIGRVRRAHKLGFCPVCSDVESSRKYRKRAGNARIRTKPKHRRQPE